MLRVQFIADRTDRQRERGRGTLGPERTASNLFLVSEHLNELPLQRFFDHEAPVAKFTTSGDIEQGRFGLLFFFKGFQFIK